MRTRTEKVIRVRFLREDNQTPSRPKKIREVTIENTDNKTGEVINTLTYYTSMIKGSIKDIPEASFITEWEKGATPKPKQRKDRIPAKVVNTAYKHLKKQKHAFDTESSKRAQTRQLLESKEVALSEVYDAIYTSNADKKIKRDAHHAHLTALGRGSRHKIGSLQGREGTITVQYRNPENPKTTLTKSFPSKGILKNQEYKILLKLVEKDDFLAHSFKAKPGSIDENRARLHKLKSDPKHIAKIKAKKTARIKRQLELQNKK